MFRIGPKDKCVTILYFNNFYVFLYSLGPMCVARLDYRREDTDEVVFKKGEKLKITNKKLEIYSKTSICNTNEV